MAALDPKLATLLAAANGKRRKLVLAADDVAAAIADALTSPTGIAVRHGGAEPLGKTTLALAVKPPNKASVTVGIRMCWADRPTPGRAWKELGPWQKDFARNADKAYAWAAAKNADRVTLKAGTAPVARAAPAGDAAKLLKEILANPTDDHARSVYADHLTLAGDPRGELITAQLALARAKKPAEKSALTKRINALMKKHRAAWVRHAMQDAKECEMTRGFVSSVRMPGIAWGARGARLFEVDPIEELRVSQGSAKGLVAIAEAAHTKRLRHLVCALAVRRAGDLAALRTFLAAPTVGAIAHLEVHAAFDGIALPADFFATLPPRSAVTAFAWHSIPKLTAAQKRDLRRVYPAATLRVS